MQIPSFQEFYYQIIAEDNIAGSGGVFGVYDTSGGTQSIFSGDTYAPGDSRLPSSSGIQKRPGLNTKRGRKKRKKRKARGK